MSISDSLNQKLLVLLGQDALQTSDMLARKLNISSATVRRRLRMLRNGKLLRLIGVVEPDKFGYPLRVVISLDVAPQNLEKAVELLANKPEVRFVASTTGRYDVIAMAHFQSTDDLSSFISRQLPQIEGVRDSETFICMDVKKGSWVPLIPTKSRVK